MLRLTVLEFFLRLIPEGFLFILGSYVFAHKKIEKKSYFASSMLFAIGIYLIRMLPIHFGVHTIIVIMLYILLITALNKIPIMKAISSSMLWIVTLAACESLNALILSYLKVDMQLTLNAIPMKMLYFAPSLVLFALIIVLVHILICKNKKEGFGDVFN